METIAVQDKLLQFSMFESKCAKKKKKVNVDNSEHIKRMTVVPDILPLFKEPRAWDVAE